MPQSLGILPEKYLQEDGTSGAIPATIERISAASSLEEILIFARQKNASDVHLCTNAPVMLRQSGEFKQACEETLGAERVSAMLKAFVPAEKWADAQKTGDLEYVHVIGGAGRFRVVVSRQRLGWDLAARLVDTKIRTSEELGMPKACEGLTKWAQGLILIAGPAGCGKTSTLASLIEGINRTRDEHIITIENPIEVVFTPKKCQISQREINLHTLSSANALRAALREDPDIIVVSELRDLETIRLAVTAAETGHLVFGTMNTNDAAQTVTSLINSYSPDEQAIVRRMISESLRGVICQRLIPRLDGTGRVAAYEVLIMTLAASSLIKSERSRQLNNIISIGKKEGMVLLDTSLEELVQKRIISQEEARRHAVNPALFSKQTKPAAPGVSHA